MSVLHCRSGDLARVISPGYILRCSCGNSAVIVKPDTMVVVDQQFADGWMLSEPLKIDVMLTCGGGHVTGKCTSLPDRLLRPIRDPGPDAIDAIDEIVKLVGIAPMTAAEVLAWSEA